MHSCRRSPIPNYARRETFPLSIATRSWRRSEIYRRSQSKDGCWHSPLSTAAAETEQALKRKRDHQKEMVLGAMGISIPLLAIAAIFTGLAGVIVVCGALAVVAYVSTR